MTQQYVAEIHTKSGAVYYYITDNLDYIAGTADWFMSESPDAKNYIGVHTNLLDSLLGLHSPTQMMLVNRGDLSHIVYLNARVMLNEDGTHTATTIG